MTNKLKPCIHAEVCAGGCDLADITECEYYSAERTCYVKQTGYATGICSACGAEFNASVVTNEPPDHVRPALYCPNCGAKVVE